MFQKEKSVNLIIGGLIGVISMFLGAYLNYYFDEAREASRFKENVHKYFFEKRFETFNRTARLFGRAPAIYDIWISHSKITGFDKDKNKNTLPKATQYTEKLEDANAEYRAVVEIGKHLFGPKTALAIAEFEMEGLAWWERSAHGQRKIIEAMAAEIGDDNIFGTVVPFTYTSYYYGKLEEEQKENQS